MLLQFRFPTDEIRRRHWSSIVRKARIDPYWKPGSCSVICSEHFDETYFYKTKGGFTRLKKEAIPTKKIAMFVEETEVRAEIEASLNPATSAMSCEQPASSSSSTADPDIEKVDMTGLDYVFDTPMKAKLRRTLELKNKICERQIDTIKKLNRKNQRLVKKNDNLKNILKKLKKNRVKDVKKPLIKV